MTTRYYKYLETFDTRILTGQFGAKARLCRCGKWPQSPADFFIFFLIRLAAMWLFYSPNDRCWSDCFVWRWHEWDPHWLQTSNNCLTSDWPPILSHFNILQPDFSMTSMTCWDLLDTDIEVSPWFHRGGCIEGGGRRSFSFWASRANSRHLPSMTIPSNMRFLGASTTARFFGPKRTCSSVSS